MKFIPLTRGQVALVDDEDYDFLMHWKWQAIFSRGSFYAVRTERIGTNRRRPVRMARVIIGAAPSEYVDHIDRATLNNQRNNLRICSHPQNSWNKGPHKNNTSGFKGVSYEKSARRWKSVLVKDGKVVFWGRFDSPEEAAKAYDAASERTLGEFALTNRQLGLLPCTAAEIRRDRAKAAAEPKETVE